VKSSPIVDAFLAELASDPEARERAANLLAEYLPQPPSTSPYLGVDEAADYLRCSRQRVYDLVHAGRLVPRRDGRRLLFHRDDLDAYLSGPQGVA
jgi:excisionase family DNA binding protein